MVENVELQPWLQRLIAEHQSVSDRLVSLKSFIESSPTYTRLGAAEQSLMRVQVLSMTTYRDILVERLRLAGRL